MSQIPENADGLMFDAFGRPPVPDLVVPRAILPFHLDERPVRGRLVRLGPLADALLGIQATVRESEKLRVADTLDGNNFTASYTLFGELK